MNSNARWDNVDSIQNDEQSSHVSESIQEDDGVEICKEKNYVPKRTTEQFLKLPYISGIAIIFILTIVIIILASLKSKSVVCNWPKWPATQEVFLNVSAEVVILDENRFFIYEPNNAGINLLHEIKNPVQSFDFDVSRFTLFWVEINSSKIMSFNLGGNKTEDNIHLIFNETRIKPCAIAIDSINNNLYVLDNSIQGLIVINLDNKYHTLLLINLFRPRYIELDTAKGIMFIGSTKEIKRADMDSKNLTDLVSSTIISGIALDRAAEKIYWINNYKIIESCDYFGQFEGTILIDSDTPILGLTILDSYIFWLRNHKESEKTTQLWTCKIQNGMCANRTIVTDGLNSSALMRVFRDDQQNSWYKNSSGQQKCEHISLATPSGVTTCVCNMSSQLVSNKTCEPIAQFLLYILNNVTRTRTLDDPQGIVVEPFWPTPYRVSNLSFNKEIDFDYDFKNDNFYFCDDHTMYKIKLKGKNPQQEIILASDDFYIEDLAYDWITENLYYSKRSKLYPGKHSLVVFNIRIGPRFEKTLMHFDYNSDNRREQVGLFQLILYPSRGLLLFAVGVNNRRIMYRATTNGTVISRFGGSYAPSSYRLIAADYDEDRLYWISSDSSMTHAEFDGSIERVVYTTSHRAKSMSINKQWVYLSNSESIFKLNKETGNDYSRISPPIDDSLKFSNIRIINQTQVVGNPCEKYFLNFCSQLCFYDGTNSSCACADGLKLTSYGACQE